MTPQYALGTNAQGQGMGSIIPSTDYGSQIPTNDLASFQKANPGQTFGAEDLQHYNNGPFTQTPTTINSQSLAPAPLMNYQQPQPIPTVDIAGLQSTAAGMQSPYASLSAPQQKEQDVNQSIQDLNSFLSGEGQFKSDQYKAQGFGTSTDANGNPVAIDPQMADLNAQLTTITNQAKAIPLEDMNSANGQNGTIAGVNATDNSRLRTNAIQALQVSSTISARNGALAHATDLVNIATQQKFGTAEAQLKAQTANLKLIQDSPQYSNAQKQQAATAAQQVQQQSAALQLQKEDYQNAQNQALQYAGSATAAQMQELQKGKTPVEVATIATQMGISTPAQQKILADLEIQKANIANLPLERQLKQAQVYEAQAGAALKQAQAKAMSNPVGTNGLVAGATGSPALDTAAQGYYTQPIAGGLTQAAIDQKALGYVTSGTNPPIGRTGIAGIQNMAISNRMAEMGQGTNLAANKAQLKSLSGSLDTQQTYHDTTQRAFNTATDNLNALTSYMSTAGINTSSQIPLGNSIGLAVSRNLLDPGAIAGYKAAISGLRTEYAQVLSRGSAGGVTDSMRSQANALIPDNLTPAQLQEVATRLNVESTNAINESQKQIDQIHGQINGIIQPTTKSSAATNITAAGVPFDYTQAKADGVSDAAIQAYLASH